MLTHRKEKINLISFRIFFLDRMLTLLTFTISSRSLFCPLLKFNSVKYNLGKVKHQILVVLKKMNNISSSVNYLISAPPIVLFSLICMRPSSLSSPIFFFSFFFIWILVYFVSLFSFYLLILVVFIG